MKRDGDNTETRALAHTSRRPVHPTLFIGQFGPRNLGAELKWRKKTKMVGKGKREGKRDKAREWGRAREKETWGVIGGMVRDRSNFESTGK